MPNSVSTAPGDRATLFSAGRAGSELNRMVWNLIGPHSCLMSFIHAKLWPRPLSASNRTLCPIRLANADITRHSPDDSETSVESSDFAASLEARREIWLATSSLAAGAVLRLGRSAFGGKPDIEQTSPNDRS